MEVTEDIICLLADYYNYDFSEIEGWSEENIINAYKSMRREIEEYED
jgi:hypothetical protein